MKYLPLLFLCGCAPYVGYTHISDPRIANDGYDLICGGTEQDISELNTDLAICQNVRGGTYIKAEFKVFLGERD